MTHFNPKGSKLPTVTDPPSRGVNQEPVQQVLSQQHPDINPIFFRPHHTSQKPKTASEIFEARPIPFKGMAVSNTPEIPTHSAKYASLNGRPERLPISAAQLGQITTLVGSGETAFNRTIVNELIDHEQEDEVMGRIETQNNIAENLRDTPDYEKEYAVPQEELEEVKEKRDYDIFHCIMPNYCLEDIYNMQHYELVSRRGATSVYALDTDYQSLKLVMQLQHAREQVLAALMDPGNYHLWNDQVDLGNVKLRIYSENAVIAYQKHKAFDRHFRERDFLYLRHLFQQNGVLYLVDKSIEHSGFPSFDYITRGDIELALWAFESLGARRTQVTHILRMNFRGTLGRNKSVESMIRYLSSMSGLSEYLQRNAISTAVEKYFDVTWRALKTPKHQDHGYKMNNLHYMDTSFDHKNSLYITAFPKIQWLNQTSQTNQSNSFIKEHLFPQEMHYRIGGDIETISNQIPKFGPEKTAQNYTPKVNSSIRYQAITLKQPMPHIAPSPNYSTQPASYELLRSSQQLKSIPVSSQTLAGYSQHGNTVHQAVPRPGDFVHKPKLRASQMQEPISDKEADQISKPQQMHHFEQVSVKLDAKTGLVVIPQDYLSKKHITQPVKSEYKLINAKTPWKDYILRDLFELLPTGELKCIKLQIMKQQARVLGYMLSTLTKTIMSGGSAYNVSMPIGIFGEVSHLEVLARGLRHAPYFLERAAKQPKSVERIKLVSMFTTSFIRLILDMEKPFNPIIGETFQGWVNGCPIYCEQILHHPPISSILMLGRGYTISASLQPKISLGLNSVTGWNQGELIIRFHNFPNNTIRTQPMVMEIAGMMYGDRKLAYAKKAFTYDETDYLFAELDFNPQKKGFLSFGKSSAYSDWAEGNIFRVTPTFMAKYRSKKGEGPSKKDIVETISAANGRWTQSLSFDGVEYFNMKRDLPCQLEQEPYPLSSNSNYRQDIIYKRKKDIARAQVQKERLEMLQREDRKLREKKRKGH